MENKKIKIDGKNIEKTNLELKKAYFNEIELEKKIINEELERGKRYLIEEVISDGQLLLSEIDRKEKKTLWNKFIDFIFK